MTDMLKRTVVATLIFVLSVAFWGCGTAQNRGGRTGADNTDGNNTIHSGDSRSSVVVYFSRTNNTERIADFITELTNSAVYEILAKDPYTDEDIRYYTDCRADREQKDPTARPEIAGESVDLSPYDVIYLGYPIWHGQAPKIMYTFVESYDLSGKTIIPFCTSASSGIGNSATNLSASATGARWLTGKRFSANAAKDEVSVWLSDLNIEQ